MLLGSFTYNEPLFSILKVANHYDGSLKFVNFTPNIVLANIKWCKEFNGTEGVSKTCLESNHYSHHLILLAKFHIILVLLWLFFTVYILMCLIQLKQLTKFSDSTLNNLKYFNHLCCIFYHIFSISSSFLLPRIIFSFVLSFTCQFSSLINWPVNLIILNVTNITLRAHKMNLKLKPKI